MRNFRPNFSSCERFSVFRFAVVGPATKNFKKAFRIFPQIWTEFFFTDILFKTNFVAKKQAKSDIKINFSTIRKLEKMIHGEKFKK